jgi:hypothetical protein
LHGLVIVVALRAEVGCHDFVEDGVVLGLGVGDRGWEAGFIVIVCVGCHVLIHCELFGIRTLVDIRAEILPVRGSQVVKEFDLMFGFGANKLTVGFFLSHKADDVLKV